MDSQQKDWFRRKLRQKLGAYHITVNPGKSVFTDGYIISTKDALEFVKKNDDTWQLVQEALKNGYTLQLVDKY